MNKAYLAGGVNQALVSREDGLYVLDGASGTAARLEGYTFSQWRLSRPEVRETEFSKESEVFEKLYIESVQVTALQEALELMDENLSRQYRETIAGLLTDRIKIHAGLLDYLTNRFYSNRLPEAFREQLALELLAGKDTSLMELYLDLSKKTRLFDVFYTHFWFRLQAPEGEREIIDERLTYCSAFANFTNALYTHSATLYDYAASLALKALDNTGITLGQEFFAELQKELARVIRFNFRNVLPFQELLSQHWLINAKPYRFFGSPVKTIYNYLNDLVPFSTEQTIQLLFDTHLPIRTPDEEEEEHEQKLYWQSVNDLDFFDSIHLHDPLKSTLALIRIENVQRCLQIAYHKNHHYVIDQIPLKRLERYSALLYADCTFLRQDFNDAAILYSELKAEMDRSRSSRPGYDHTILITGIMVRLGKTYEMLNERKKAVSYYRRAFRLLTSYINRQSGRITIQGSFSKPTEENYPVIHTVMYAEAVAGKVAEIISASEQRG